MIYQCVTFLQYMLGKPFYSRHRIFLKYSHCHHRNHLYNLHIQSHYPESSPQGLASN